VSAVPQIRRELEIENEAVTHFWRIESNSLVFAAIDQLEPTTGHVDEVTTWGNRINQAVLGR
jgi:hypothetical protein